MKSKVRDHIVWKSEPIWRLRLKEVEEQMVALEPNMDSTSPVK